MIKALLFDIDGIIIRHESLFEDHLENMGYKNYSKIIRDFDNSELNKKCDRGILSPEDVLIPILDKINWKKDVEEYLNEKHCFEEKFINYDLIAKIKEYKSKGKYIFIASNQNIIRKEFLIGKMKLETVFDECYFSCDLNAIKTDERYWDMVFKKLKNIIPDIKTGEVLFIDDSIRNIETASNYGINSIQYQFNSKKNLFTMIDEEISKFEEEEPSAFT